MLPTLRSDDDSRPRFEFYPANSPTLRTVYVERTPFTIGRGDETELQISCKSVSREHARLTRTQAGYRLRDLGSTNGTWINGEAVVDAALEDGDAVRIADIELTFVCSSLGRLQRMVTQPLAAAAKPAPQPTGSISDDVATLRALSEALLWLAIPLRRDAIIEMASGAALASLCSIDEPLAARLQAAEAASPCSTAARLQELAWQLAAGQAAHASDASGSSATSAAGCTFLRVERRASLDERLLDAFEQALEWAASPAQLGVLIPWEWVTESPLSLRICGELRSLGAQLALERFAGGAKCIDALEMAPPDYLIMDADVLRGVSSHQRRLQRLEIVQASCEAAGIRGVLPPGTQQADLQACQSLGIGLGMAAGSAGSARHAAPVAAMA